MLRNSFISLFSCFFLASCVQVFPPSKKVNTLLLAPDFIEALPRIHALKKVNWQLVIPKPSINSYLDKDLVMVEDLSGTARYLSHLKWPDLLPDFLQSLLIDGFIASDKIIGVSESSLRVTPHYLLQTDFNKFHVLKKGENDYALILEATAQLIDFKTRNVLALRSFELILPLKKTTNKVLRDTFSLLLKDFLHQLIPWCLTHTPQTSKK